MISVLGWNSSEYFLSKIIFYLLRFIMLLLMMITTLLWRFVSPGTRRRLSWSTLTDIPKETATSIFRIASFLQMSVNGYQTIRHYIQEISNLRSHGREKFKSSDNVMF
jgi:hypothetical protein